MGIAVGIQHAMHMHHIAISGLPGSTVFFHSISQKQHGLKKSS